MCAVVILAVQERPGRRSILVGSSVTTTLKSLASSVPVVDCEVATPVGAQERLIANLSDLAGEGLAREGIDGHTRCLAERNVDDVGLVDFDFGRDDGHVGERHQG